MPQEPTPQVPRPQDVMELQGPQGAQGTHIPVFTARFPLQGALQALPVTGLEPDVQRSPQTTPPRELLTPANPKALVKILRVSYLIPRQYPSPSIST